MKIAVTAASGKLGSEIIRKLVALTGNDGIIGIVRTPKKAVHLGVEIRRGEFEMNSDFESAAGRKHICWEKYFEQLS